MGKGKDGRILLQVPLGSDSSRLVERGIVDVVVFEIGNDRERRDGVFAESSAQSLREIDGPELKVRQSHPG